MGSYQVHSKHKINIYVHIYMHNVCEVKDQIIYDYVTGRLIVIMLLLIYGNRTNS